MARFVRGRRLPIRALAGLSGRAGAGLFAAASGSGWLGFPPLYPEAGTVPEGLFYGFLFGFVLLVSQEIVGPLAPATPDEPRERRRESLRAAVLVGLVSLALVVVALVVFAVLALVAHGVAALYG